MDRNTQIKYDIAKNEGGPLGRTVGSTTMPSTNGKGKGKEKSAGLEGEMFDERTKNVEDHLAIRYGVF